MKVSGFTFIRNAILYGYPIVESILSALPICDEFIVSVGDSIDGTLELIKRIDNPKIKIVQSIWDESLLTGGKILSVETNKALAAVDQNSDWAFYIQGDEVLHEKYLLNIQTNMHQYLDAKEIDGLLFDYVHFYGSFDYVGNSSAWYPHEIRIIRNSKNIYSYRDAQGFRKDNNKKLQVKKAEACMYHYGWVREPKVMNRKQTDIGRFYNNTNAPITPPEVWVGDFDYTNIKSLKKFTGTHPKVMLERIKQKNWYFEYDLSKSAVDYKDIAKKLLKKIGINTYYENYILIP
ncbi:MAG: hypothetical protein QM528_00575 [Phycisphaerales bacterium]|nr:hypothetical protein [Phycisphaerales bacterium]